MAGDRTSVFPDAGDHGQAKAMSDVKPALTAEEWAEAIDFKGGGIVVEPLSTGQWTANGVTTDCTHIPGERRHEIGARCLRDQPFGFTMEDVLFINGLVAPRAMHITAEDIVVEIIDREGRAAAAGEQGEIVVTHLATSDFPFIRYRTGDIGMLDSESCPCGRGLPLLKEVAGRTTDFIVAPDGTLMHGLALIYVVRSLPGIAAFKIIQESLSEIRVQLVPAPDFDPAAEDAIRRGLQERLGQAVRVVVERVSHIPKERSGKFRHVVSHISAEHMYDTEHDRAEYSTPL